MIGIICAMKSEASVLLDEITDKKEYKFLDKIYWQGSINQKQVVLTISGVGKVNAGVATALMIEHFPITLIINTGVAGGYDSSLSTLDMVLALRVAYYDFDISFDDDYAFGQVPDCPLWFKSDRKALSIASKAPINTKLVLGTGMSGDRFVTKRQTIMDALIKMDEETVHAIDMESAPIAQIATIQQIPFIIIRSISDIIEEEAQSKTYYNWLDQAARNAVEITKYLIEHY